MTAKIGAALVAALFALGLAFPPPAHSEIPIPGESFAPGRAITRGEFSAVLWRWQGSPEGESHIFSDVPSDVFYSEAVDWLASIGATNGTTPTTFSPDEPVTRAQMAAFLRRIEHPGAVESESQANPFTDVSEYDWFFDAVSWLYQTGATTGTSDTTFSPDRWLTRVEAITVIWRLTGSPPATILSPFVDVGPDTTAVHWGYENGIVNGVGIDWIPWVNWNAALEEALYRASYEFGINLHEFVAITKCESRGDVNAISALNANGSRDYGALQHNNVYGPGRFAMLGYDFATQWNDPVANVRVAAWYRINLGRWGGSSGWACAAIVGLY